MPFKWVYGAVPSRFPPGARLPFVGGPRVGLGMSNILDYIIGVIRRDHARASGDLGQEKPT